MEIRIARGGARRAVSMLALMAWASGCVVGSGVDYCLVAPAPAGGNARLQHNDPTLPAFDLCVFHGMPPGSPGGGAAVEAGAPELRRQLGLAGGLRRGQAAVITIPTTSTSPQTEFGLVLVEPDAADCAAARPIMTAQGLPITFGGSGTPLTDPPGAGGTQPWILTLGGQGSSASGTGSAEALGQSRRSPAELAALLGAGHACGDGANQQ
jgi:hypothetical protein